ncbi:MAG: hypothetical protein II908_09665, partial [Bacteroidaceae bacterium]|nr:hypothetical protein [Bacteroidaceae bacterium]
TPFWKVDRFTSSTDRFFLTTTKVRNCLELLLFFSTNLLSCAAAPQSSANLEKVENRVKIGASKGIVRGK